ncbi:MAG: phosphoenolpyruvate synthase [Bdellovibrionaceae bacterium]|nr:phosphoenolpyruvate synthase [Pseudobdellovibrionaceae bacterium]
MNQSMLVKWFNELSIDTVPEVGGKNASLGEMIRELGPKGVQVPDGFAVTAQAYRYFIETNHLSERIGEILTSLKKDDLNSLRDCGHRIRQLILHAEIPDLLQKAIGEAYQKLGEEYFENPDVAVRSSATAEDLPDASFAGQQETYLNVEGLPGLLDACRKCFASLFTDRAISYREHKRFDHFKIALSVGVQKMVRSDLASSGVMFSIDTESGFKDAVLINASYGLGENVVQGAVNPDEFYVFKPTLKDDLRPILRRNLGTKEFKLVYDVGGSKMVKNVPVPIEERQTFSINDDDILQLAKWACTIEEHYSKKRGTFAPMDMEWAKDGESGELFIVQARPETVQSQKAKDEIETYTLERRGKVIIEGRSVGEKISSGKVRVIRTPQQLGELQDGEVLVTEKTDPDWEPAMKKAAAIITNRGGRTCHAAIVSRELGLPAIVGTERGTEALRTGMQVTVSCAEGDSGYVYEGTLPFHVEKVSIKDLKTPKTAIMMNVANPDEAFHLSFLPNAGVGLARMEFVINHSIKIHPMALIRFDQLDEVKAKEKIERRTIGYSNKSQYFVDKLAEGIGTIAAAFYPKDVIVRMSDFKTNEYAELLGGRAFEPHEENPMIGFRGASRYYDPKYQPGFELECQAMKKVRNEMGLKNLKLMIPFCRTVNEGRKVLSVMEAQGLKRGEDGLEVYVMCEIPSNVILAEEFAHVFDGFSIGSNDLTQLTLGVDRDSEIIAHLFDERNEAVKALIRQVVRIARQKNKKIGICGQAPSDYPEFAEFLVKEGIHSISLNPDVVLKTTQHISELEEKGQQL